MRKFQIILALIIALVFSYNVGPAYAQDLYFEVPQQTVIVFVNPDGTLTLDYTITFNNLPNRAVSDIVDIGLPNSNYQLNNILAGINGNPLTDIRHSTVVSPGIEVHLEEFSIQPGQQGTLNVRIESVERALGKSTLEEPEEYASIVFSPNYFDGAFVSGQTDYTFRLVLPTGLDPEEPRYHTPSTNWPGAPEPETRFDELGRVEYTWKSLEADSSSVYIFGASFPIRLVPASVVVATPTPTRPAIDFGTLFGCLFTIGIIFFMVGIPILGAISARKRRLKYLPPKISVEGHGIKRGLTAVEAAVLMEQPLDKVMTMILFSVLKKGAATVQNRDPLKLQVSKPLPEGLLPYETTFLEAYNKPKDREQRTELQNTMVGLVKSISEKMKGFSRKESLTYYQSIMEKAWAQVSAADTPEVKANVYEEVMDWTMLDRGWDGRTRDVFGTEPLRVPTWWWRYDPVVRAPGGGFGGLAMPTAPSVPGGSINIPKLPGSDFAASMVNSVQSFSSGVIGNLGSFTSEITNRTNPVPKSTSSGGRSGGGGSSCACACACAGCACACAGGGR